MSVSRSVLSTEVIEEIKSIEWADILVGIPSYRNSGTISHVLRTVSEGLALHFPGLKAVIVNSDGGSDDGTMEAATSTPVAPGIAKIVTEYRGRPGKGSAFRTLFEIADRLNVKICIVVDSDLRSITPDWIRLLGEPVYKYNYGFVAPFYARDKFDGTITNSIAYPLMCALYGRAIRQPIGGEFALSGGLAKILSHQNVWETDVAGFGIDIWLTTTAVCEGFSVCQADMGVKIHNEKDPGADLAPMFKQVVGTIFDLMHIYQVKWQVINGCRPVELLGSHPKKPHEPITVDLPQLVGRFHEEFARHKSLLPAILSADAWAQIKQLAVNVNGVVPRFPDRLWARAVFDHAVAYCFVPELDRDDVLSSLLSLFLGRTAGFVQVARALTDVEVEETILDTAAAFAAEKPYLTERWGAGKKALSR